MHRIGLMQSVRCLKFSAPSGNGFLLRRLCLAFVILCITFFVCLLFWHEVTCQLFLNGFFNRRACVGRNSMAFRVWVLQESYFPAFPRIYEPAAR